jgi:hypothetical protein
MTHFDLDRELSDYEFPLEEIDEAAEKDELALMKAVAEKQRHGMSVEEAASAVSRETGRSIKAVRGDIGVTFSFDED